MSCRRFAADPPIPPRPARDEQRRRFLRIMRAAEQRGWVERGSECMSYMLTGAGAAAVAQGARAA